ncbi:MAG TPA: hypothetical protein VMW72_05270 [Sedimentisphaerales bacterium]|nr:hypothetical protein [Sedimentisphaerales bacterium]
MSGIDEKEIKRRFEVISHFEPGSEVAARDVEQLRRRLIRHMSGQQPREQKIWRIIMKSKITKITAAAVIIGAVILGLTITGGPDMASVTWADVLKEMEKVPTVVFNMTNVTSFGENKTISTESKVYDAGENGCRIDMYMNGDLFMQKYRLPKEKVAYRIGPKEKTYSRFVLSESQAETESDFPRQWVKIILSEDYTKLGRGNINGIDVEGVEVHNSELLEGDEGVVRLWVDIETNLPVRMELEGKMMMDAGAKRPTKFVMDDFQWDVELDESVFEPNIPEDYRLIIEKLDEQKSTQVEQKSPRLLTDTEKDEQPMVKEVVRKLFQACSEEDWNEFSNLWPGLKINQIQKTILGGLEIIHIGEPFKTDDSAMWYVPYQIKLKPGEVKKRNLRVRYEETTKRFIACGGL